MSKLRCYDRNNGRSKIIEFVKYSRSVKRLSATGTDNIMPEKLNMRDIINDHYNQANSYIERIQAHFPFGTAKKHYLFRKDYGYTV